MYEQFRSCLVLELTNNGFHDKQLQEILSCVDKVSDKYHFERKETGIIVYNDVPEILKIFLASKAVENCKKGTLQNYYQVVSAFFRFIPKPYNQIGANDIRMFLFDYRKKRNVKDSTLEHVRICLNTFFSWLVSEEYIDRNPVQKIQPISVPESTRHAMSPMELEYIRGACENERERAIVEFLYSTGCRVSEMTDMKLEDVDFMNGTAKVLHGKGDKARTVYLNPKALVAIDAYLKTRKFRDEWLFNRTHRPGGKISKKAVEQTIQNIASRVGDKLKTHVTPHVFRHTNATEGLRRGMPVEQIQRELGHSKIETTMRYARLNDTEVQLSHSKYIG